MGRASANKASAVQLPKPHKRHIAHNTFCWLLSPLLFTAPHYHPMHTHKHKHTQHNTPACGHECVVWRVCPGFYN